MFKNIIYVFYNILYQILSLFFLMYAQEYINGLFVPESFLWENGKPRKSPLFLNILLDLGTLIIEGGLLVVLLYFINRWYLRITKSSVNKVAKRTTIEFVIITSFFIGLLMYVGINNYSSLQ